MAVLPILCCNYAAKEGIAAVFQHLKYEIIYDIDEPECPRPWRKWVVAARKEMDGEHVRAAKDSGSRVSVVLFVFQPFVNPSVHHGLLSCWSMEARTRVRIADLMAGDSPRTAMISAKSGGRRIVPRIGICHNRLASLICYHLFCRHRLGV